MFRKDLNRETSAPKAVVMKFIEDQANKGRTLYVDNLYISRLLTFKLHAENTHLMELFDLIV